MPANKDRKKAIQSAIERIHDIEREDGVTLATLERIKQELIALAEHAEWFTEEEFPAPPKSSLENSCVYRLSEDTDNNRFSLYIQSVRPPLSTKPHNHDTWAVIVGIHGDELNHFYKRTEGGVELFNSKVVRKGTGVVLLPDDLHSIHVADECTVINFHMYGMGLEYLANREFYDSKKGEWRKFPVYDDIREARYIDQ